jgi:DNA-binding transcriptional MocR family regulator
MPDQDLPTYRRIADDLRAAIATGKLAPGEKLRSENELKDQYGTTRVTVRKATRATRRTTYSSLEPTASFRRPVAVVAVTPPAEDIHVDR